MFFDSASALTIEDLRIGPVGISLLGTLFILEKDDSFDVFGKTSTPTTPHFVRLLPVILLDTPSVYRLPVLKRFHPSIQLSPILLFSALRWSMAT